ncbi:hypothetical protein LEP1GSC125_1383 [Leptospira mayottensis 200901122]|uniref:Uncharacterized protein n=1 Tax=Leptospira mayottensis 200901122 TaxID=1193010 RepID=A0AA87SX33_9LEPT|nr:hypothetical protein LEP1GSC125_1383 [Leptospira mayottensis 200901122]
MKSEFDFSISKTILFNFHILKKMAGYFSKKILCGSLIKINQFPPHSNSLPKISCMKFIFYFIKKVSCKVLFRAGSYLVRLKGNVIRLYDKIL